jgi:hypothetical protein
MRSAARILRFWKTVWDAYAKSWWRGALPEGSQRLTRERSDRDSIRETYLHEPGELVHTVP